MISQKKETEPTGIIGKWLGRAVVACLFLFVAFAPHSIAVTQTAWLLGMLFWVVRFAFYPPPRVYRTPIDYALIRFFLLSRRSSFLFSATFILTRSLRHDSL